MEYKSHLLYFIFWLVLPWAGPYKAPQPAEQVGLCHLVNDVIDFLIDAPAKMNKTIRDLRSYEIFLLNLLWDKLQSNKTRASWLLCLKYLSQVDIGLSWHLGASSRKLSTVEWVNLLISKQVDFLDSALDPPVN